MRKLTVGQGGDYTTTSFLVYDYIKNHYRMIAINLNQQKELVADPKVNQQS